jgi:hypothetical protein
MVLYHANGRVVKAHEDYLEREAARHATTPNIQYEDQIEVCKKHTPEAREQESRAYIIIVDQTWHTLYAKNFGTLWEEITDFKRRDDSDSMPEQGVDRATLIQCSTFADEYFRYRPDQVELHLPVCYPRLHREGDFDIDEYGPKKDNVPIYPGLQYGHRDDDQMAYIRPEEIEN